VLSVEGLIAADREPDTMEREGVACADLLEITVRRAAGPM
jgi:hypothetical protein